MMTGTAGRWQAEIRVSRRKVPMAVEPVRRDDEPGVIIRHVRSYHVELSRPGCEPIRFAVSRRKGRLTFCDYRELHTGTAGTTGYWGDRTPQEPGGRRRSLTPPAWVAEVSRLIGTDRATEIVRLLA